MAGGIFNRVAHIENVQSPLLGLVLPLLQGGPVDAGDRETLAGGLGAGLRLG